MTIDLLLSELRTITPNNVSEERLAAYTDLCETCCEWYSVLGPDEEIAFSWKECRECLVLLYGIYRRRFGLTETRAGLLRCLIPMLRLSRRLRMYGRDTVSGCCGPLVDRFFTTWENAGFPRPDDCEEELDLLTLIYEDRRDVCNVFPSDNICRYYSVRMTEILAALLERTSGTDSRDGLMWLRSVTLLVKSRGCCLDLHRDTEIRKLCRRYVSESLSMIPGFELHGQEFLRSDKDLQRYLCRLRVLQELFELCSGWFDNAFYDRFVTVSGQLPDRLRPQTDAWWQGRSILLRQHLAEYCV